MTRRCIIAYQACLAGLALVLLGLALPSGLGSPLAVAGLAVVAAIAERGRVRLDNKTEVSISVLPTVFAAAVFGPFAGLLVSAASMIGDAPFRWPGVSHDRLVPRSQP